MKPLWTSRTRRFEETAIVHMAALYRIARQMTDAHTAEDLVQETYLRAWKYFDAFDPVTNCRAWLFRILRNVWIDRYRRPRLEIPLADPEAAAVEPYYDWEERFLKNEFSEDVAQALAQLPSEYRWAVLLVEVEEFSYQEIAEVMSCPIGTVMSRINRGRRMLARLLSERTEERKAADRQPAPKNEERA